MPAIQCRRTSSSTDVKIASVCRVNCICTLAGLVPFTVSCVFNSSLHKLVKFLFGVILKDPLLLTVIKFQARERAVMCVSSS